MATDVAAWIGHFWCDLCLQLRYSSGSRKLRSPVGRTGRAGKSGQSITFVAPNEMGYLQITENLTKKRMKGLKPATAEEASKLRKRS